jgi:hypothetical protein
MMTSCLMKPGESDKLSDGRRDFPQKIARHADCSRAQREIFYEPTPIPADRRRVVGRRRRIRSHLPRVP